VDAPGTTLTDETVDVTLVVALTGNDTTGTGTAASPCRTIAKGRAEARTLGVPPISVGSSQIPNPDAKRVKVLVRAGTYREGDIQSDIFQDSVETLILAGEVDSSGRPATIMSGFEVWDDDAWTDKPGPPTSAPRLGHRHSRRCHPATSWRSGARSSWSGSVCSNRG